MPVIKHDNGMYSWGNGPTIYHTKEEARNAGIVIEIAKHKKLAKLIANEQFKDYPNEVTQTARQVIRMKDEFKDEVKGLTRTGYLRANMLANKHKISYETVKRMSTMVKPEKFLSEDHLDPIYVSWMSWGGEHAQKWAKAKLEMLDKKACK